MCQGNIPREDHGNSYRILDTFWWAFVKYCCSLLELFKTMLCFFKAVYFRGCTSLFRALSIPQPHVSQQSVFSAGWKISGTAESSSGNRQPQWYTYILISHGRMAQSPEVWIPILLLIYLNKTQFKQSKCKLTNMDYTEHYNILLRSYYSSSCFQSYICISSG